MSDSAFATRAYPAYTTDQLKDMVKNAIARGSWETVARMANELARRELVRQGDVSVMTAGERLQHAKSNPNYGPVKND